MEGLAVVAKHEPRFITATEARVHLGKVIEDVRFSADPIFVEKSGVEVLVMLSPSEYRRLAAQDLGVWDRIDQIRRGVASLTESKGIDDADRLIDEGRD